MADNFTANPGSGGDTFASDDVGGVQYPYSKIDIGGDGVSSPLSAANPMPVSGTFWQTTQPVSGPLTDAQLRAAAVPVSGPLTDAQLRATPVPQRVASFNYPISTNNSSTAQLTAGSSFTGVIESPQDQPSMSILLTSDQNTTITVRQFIDIAGVFAAPDIVFYVPAGQGFARSLAINGNFVQVIAQNTGASTTTTFNLNVAFGVLGDSDSSGVLPVTELPLVLTGAAAQTATVNNILLPTSGAAGLSVAGYRAASVQVVSTGTGGTFIFEQSNDNFNWIALPVFNAALVTAVPITAAITATASQIIYTFPLRANFVRLRIATLITGGSIRAFSRISTEPWVPTVNLVASNVAANLNATVSGTVTANIGTGALAAGTNAIGDVGIQYRANATGAATTLKFAAGASVNNALVLTGARRLLGWSLTNTTASFRYFRFYNKATAPTSGESPTFMVGLPPNSTVISPPVVGGIAMGLGLGIACTAGVADTDATVTVANDVVGAIYYA